MLMCIRCSLEYGGIAKVGMPCAYCDDTIINVQDEILAIVHRYSASWALLVSIEQWKSP